MHDLDRTTLETNGYDYEEAYDMDQEMDDEYDYEMDDEYDDEYDYEMDDEYQDEYDQEMDDEYDNEYDHEMHDEYQDEYDQETDEEYDYEMDDEYRNESSRAFSDEEEAELAMELLSVNSEVEMDEFLKKLIGRVAKKVKKYARRPFGIIKKGLRKAAKYALPIAGRFVGGAFGGPLGGKIGGKIGNYASKMFEIELEGLSPEDQEFEVAKRYVRFAGAATRKSLQAARRTPGQRAVRMGFRSAARMHAPGMLKPIRHRQHHGTPGRSGRWIRRGNKIILYNA